MSGVLARILAQKRLEVGALRMVTPPPPADPRGILVVERLRRGSGPLRLLTEIKRRSPSAGALSTALSVAERARIYADGGAAMISVLADQAFFDGSWDHVAEARRAAGDTLILAKEFVVDERQIDEAAGAGADAVLLIVRCLEAGQLEPLVRHARGRGLEPLVEIVDERELETAVLGGATLVGVNARDLDTLAMDAARAARVLGQIPPECIKLHLSGVKSPDDVTTLAANPGVDGALIGEALMRADDPSPLLRAMRAAAVG